MHRLACFTILCSEYSRGDWLMDISWSFKDSFYRLHGLRKLVFKETNRYEWIITPPIFHLLGVSRS